MHRNNPNAMQQPNSNYRLLYILSFYYIEPLVLDSKVFLIFCPRQSYK